jgi:thiamine-monophosphate kinase
MPPDFIDPAAFLLYNEIMKLSDLGEFGLIEKIKGIFSEPGGKVIKGIGDDCAVVESSNGRVTLLTTDVLLEGVHFKREYISPENLGCKAMAVNISDIAAMGGKPLYALITFASPETVETAYIEDILSGIKSISREFGIETIGGDTSLSPDRLIVNIFLVGEASKDEVLYRSGAGPGQVVFVTGELGSSAAGLDILNRGIKSEKYTRRAIFWHHPVWQPRSSMYRTVSFPICGISAMNRKWERSSRKTSSRFLRSAGSIAPISGWTP